MDLFVYDFYEILLIVKVTAKVCNSGLVCFYVIDFGKIKKSI